MAGDEDGVVAGHRAGRLRPAGGVDRVADALGASGNGAEHHQMGTGGGEALDEPGQAREPSAAFGGHPVAAPDLARSEVAEIPAHA